jgi:hypothetical protein
MGQSQSIDSSLVQQNALIQEIHNVAQILSEKYSSQFLDPNFCNRIALIYNDKLQRYRRQDLDGISYTLGIVSDIPATKGKVCEAIVKHYTDRINLIAGIQYSLSYVSDRIFALTTGPRCDGNPEIFDQEQCTLSGGQWQNYLVQPDQKIDENRSWFTYLKSMQDNYLGSLSKLLGLIRQLENYDNDINDERLKILSDEAKTTIDAMHQHSYQMYKLILTTPTYTNEELKLLREQDLIKKQDQAARLSALRTANGLPA